MEYFVLISCIGSSSEEVKGPFNLVDAVYEANEIKYNSDAVDGISIEDNEGELITFVF